MANYTEIKQSWYYHNKTKHNKTVCIFHGLYTVASQHLSSYLHGAQLHHHQLAFCMLAWEYQSAGLRTPSPGQPVFSQSWWCCWLLALCDRKVCGTGMSLAAYPTGVHHGQILWGCHRHHTCWQAWSTQQGHLLWPIDGLVQDCGISRVSAMEIQDFLGLSHTTPADWHDPHSRVTYYDPDRKVHGANMGPTWVLSAPDGPHVGPMNLVIRGPIDGLVQDWLIEILHCWCKAIYQWLSARLHHFQCLLGMEVPQSCTNLSHQDLNQPR